MSVPTLFGNDVVYIAVTKTLSTRTVEKLKINRMYDTFFNNEICLKVKSIDGCNWLLQETADALQSNIIILRL